MDANGHASAAPTSANLTAGAVSTTAAGTIAPTTAAGATPTVTFATGQVATDDGGSFTLNPVTGGGAQAAGDVAVVTFATPYPATPKAVLVQLYDQAAGSTAALCAADSISATGFKVSVNSALTTAHSYTVQYWVIPAGV
jgi:hypothetical protein